MKYMGSKGRHARELLPIILRDRKPGQAYVEPFVGGANIIDKVDGFRLGADSHANLIALLRAASSGWTPPAHVSEALYRECQEAAKGGYVSPTIGYVGFAMSYGGKWFGGYRRDKTGQRDYADESYRSALKQFPMLKDVEFQCADYRELAIPHASVIYCDPPYASTTGYSVGDFDHDSFWRWCGTMALAGHSVFVSEYAAPIGWKAVWEKRVNNTLVEDTGAKQAVEKLFTLA